MRARAQALCCCPACAASVGRRRSLWQDPGLALALAWRRVQAWRAGRAPRNLVERIGGLWLALLVVLAALVPFAAASGGEGSEAPGPFASPVGLPAPVAPFQITATRLVAGERSGALIEWHESEALGGPNGGTLVDGVRLPARGRGYYTYDPRTQAQPGGLDTRWGTARLVRTVMALGEWWARTHPDQPPLGIGDLSHEHGGPIDGHASHQNGLDVDVRLPRSDGAIGAADPSTYDRALTQDVVDWWVGSGASLVLIGPSLDLTGPGGVVVRWPNHDDHLHVRIPGAGGPIGG